MFCNSFVLLHVLGAVPHHSKAYVCLTQASQNTISSSVSVILWTFCMITGSWPPASLPQCVHLHISHHTAQACKPERMLLPWLSCSRNCPGHRWFFPKPSTFHFLPTPFFVHLSACCSSALSLSLTVRLNLFLQALPKCPTSKWIPPSGLRASLSAEALKTFGFRPCCEKSKTILQKIP